MRIDDGTEKAIYNFLKKNRDELFSLEELVEILKKKGVISPDANFEERRMPTRVALANLIAIDKVARFNHQGEDYFGVK